MGQICLRIQDELEKKLRISAEKRGINVSNYIRNLLKLGLKVESGNAANNLSSDTQKALLKLQIKSHKSAIENLLITRQIFAKICEDKDPNYQEILKRLCDKSQAYVDDLVGESRLDT